MIKTRDISRSSTTVISVLLDSGKMIMVADGDEHRLYTVESVEFEKEGITLSEFKQTACATLSELEEGNSITVKRGTDKSWRITRRDNVSTVGASFDPKRIPEDAELFAEFDAKSGRMILSGSWGI